MGRRVLPLFSSKSRGTFVLSFSRIENSIHINIKPRSSLAGRVKLFELNFRDDVLNCQLHSELRSSRHWDFLEWEPYDSRSGKVIRLYRTSRVKIRSV